ncbi:hypothetical protein [Sulfitobacter pontiacus]|jgi:hypothetical protein|uniref:hypothetical protein n=1 Tax=Sulfitobacter pontiacus TaxID=60137 RepID=UPI0030EDE0EF|tara:strand:+ start:871 stop:1242 length:372 start_codon:yes stop_codon:yes gene_type:complete
MRQPFSAESRFWQRKLVKYIVDHIRDLTRDLCDPGFLFLHFSMLRLANSSCRLGMWKFPQPRRRYWAFQNREGAEFVSDHAMVRRIVRKPARAALPPMSALPCCRKNSMSRFLSGNSCNYAQL